MPLFTGKTRKTVATLREQGRSAACGLRDTFIHAATHLRALVDLFGVELREYASHQTKRAVAMATGLFLLVCGYFLFCATVCLLLSDYIGLLWGMGIVCLIHFLAAGILITLAIKCKPGSMAPATRQELTNDLQCLKILLKDKKENC